MNLQRKLAANRVRSARFARAAYLMEETRVRLIERPELTDWARAEEVFERCRRVLAPLAAARRKAARLTTRHNHRLTRSN